jgi:proteasome lid subunit RPN8/RPN11
MLEAENLVRERRWDVVGVYHSHPDHPAHPSKFDREHAILHYSYIIVSVTKDQAGDMSCWTFGGDSRFRPDELRVSD